MEFGIAVFDIDLKPSEDSDPTQSVNLLALYGPYASREQAEEYCAFVEDDTRKRFADRFGEGRYEFHLKVTELQTAPVLQEGWL